VITLLLIWGNFSLGQGAGLYAQTQSGKASYYAKSWTGRRTSNGERLHHDSMTCAHKTLPFGTLLKVTNLLNGKQVVVRVTDRGPYVRGRVVDLSWGAAKAIGMLSQGIAPVSVERVTTSTIPFKPEEDDPDVPKFDFELADIAPVGITPVWQREAKIDPLKVQRSMSQTANESNANIQRDDEETDNVIDEINQTPNAAKAYLKRQGQQK
jgi:rare lipoprotein A